MECSKEILIACALKKEAKVLREALGLPAQILVTGLGTDRTLNTLERTFEQGVPKVLLFTGMGGQLDPELALGDFVFPRTWRFESGTGFDVPQSLADSLTALGYPIEGVGITVRRPVVRAAARLRLFTEEGARICDMESAAAMMISSSYKIPCLAPKVISDTKDSGMLAFYSSFNKNIERLAESLAPLINDLTALIDEE